MRIAAIGLAGALGLAVSALSANAAPFVPASAGADSAIIEVAGGCGRGFHQNRWGRCVPHRYSQARPRGYWRWHSPTDFMARDLNRRELGRVYSGGGVYYGPGIDRGY